MRAFAGPMDPRVHDGYFYAIRPPEKRFETWKLKWGSVAHKKLCDEEKAFRELQKQQRARFRQFLVDNRIRGCDSGGWGFKKKSDAEEVRNLFEAKTGIAFEVIEHFYL